MAPKRGSPSVKLSPAGQPALTNAYRAVRTKLDQGQKVIPSSRPFEQLAWEWFEREKDRLRPNTRRNYESALRLHVLPRLGRLKPAEITEERVVELIRAMEREGKAESTVKNALAPLSRILNYLTRRGMVSANVLSRLERDERPKKSPKQPKRILDREEIRRLLDASEGRYRLIHSMALNTGMRQGEILGLIWANIDFENESIRVEAQIERGQKEAGLWIPPHRVDYAKTDAGARSIDLIPSDLFKALREYKLASPHSQPDDLVFCTEERKPLVHRNVSQRGLASAKRRAKIDGNGKPNLRFHDLRHTYASAAISAGVDAYYLSRQLGHDDAAFTQRTYVDLFEAREKAEASRNLLKASGYSGLI